MDHNDIKKLAENKYCVKSTKHDTEYEVDTSRWTCTCSVGRTGYPSGEPCKHQHAVANKHNLTAPTLVPYFNGDGRYLHAVIALGVDKAGDRSFYSGITGDIQSATMSFSDNNSTQDNQEQSANNDSSMDVDCDSGAENLDLMVDLLDTHQELQSEIIKLCNSFVEDVGERMRTLDMQYLTGLKKFFSVYLDTVADIEPTSSATPKLSSLLHTYFSNTQPSVSVVAGTRKMHVQPTAISRRRNGITKGSHMALSGRPCKRQLEDNDENTQTKRGRKEHTKRKQNLRKNELKNQANHFKHGRGH